MSRDLHSHQLTNSRTHSCSPNASMNALQRAYDGRWLPRRAELRRGWTDRATRARLQTRSRPRRMLAARPFLDARDAIPPKPLALVRRRPAHRAVRAVAALARQPAVRRVEQPAPPVRRHRAARARLPLI